MPDLAQAQDDLGTVHFSRFMLVGDEKLLFLSDIDGEGDEHIERLVESAGPVFDAIFEHVDNPPRRPWPMITARRQMVEASCPRAAGHVLRLRGRVGSGHQGVRTGGGLHGRYGAAPAADLHDHQVTVAGLCLEAGREVHPGRCHAASDSLGTLHVAHFVPFEHNHLGFFTVFDGDMEKYFQDFAEKTAFIFDALFKHVDGAPPTPVAQNAHAFYEWAWRTTTSRSGSTAPTQASAFKTSEPPRRSRVTTGHRVTSATHAEQRR